MTELSVIITTSGTVKTLEACLEALRHQTLAATNFEVIVMVRDSPDVTSEMLTNLRTPYKLCVLHQNNCGQPVALYNAVEAAAGHYCLFIEDDIVAHPTLTAEHLRIQKQREGVIGIGQILLILPTSADAFAHYATKERRDRYSQLNRGQLPSLMDSDSGNLSMPRAAVLEICGLTPDLAMTGNLELAYHLERLGLPLVYIPDAIAEQGYRKAFLEIAADAVTQGGAEVTLYQRHPPMLPHLTLGAFYNMSRSAIVLRRLLLILGVSTRLVAIIGLLLAKRGRIREWYQFVYHYCYWCGVRRAVSDRDTWRRLTRCPLILMYHAIGRKGEPAGRYLTPRRRFALQMAWLKWIGYHVLSLEEFLHDRYEHRLSPACSVILTFDDGYADNWTVAYPVLRRYAFPATIFLVSGMMGGTNRWDKEGDLVGRPLLSWSEVYTMLKGGMGFGAHTQSHIPLTLLSSSKVKEEVEGSQADLEGGLGLPILAFAYPHGEYNPAIQALVEQAGFLGACSCHPGMNDPVVARHALRRFEVRGTDSFVHFVLALWLGISPRSDSYRSVSRHADLDLSKKGELYAEATHDTRSVANGGRHDASCGDERGHLNP